MVPAKGETEGATDRKDGDIVIGPLELSLEMHARSEPVERALGPISSE